MGLTPRAWHWLQSVGWQRVVSEEIVEDGRAWVDSLGGKVSGARKAWCGQMVARYKGKCDKQNDRVRSDRVDESNRVAQTKGVRERDGADGGGMR